MHSFWACALPMAQPASGEDTWNSAVTYPSASLLIPVQNSKYDAQVCGSMTVRLHKASFLPCLLFFIYILKIMCMHVYLCVGMGTCVQGLVEPRRDQQIPCSRSQRQL